MTRDYQVIRPSFHRRLSMDAFDALPPAHAMTALVDVDVTDLSAHVAAEREQGVRTSVFAHVVEAIAQTMIAHPELNAMRHGLRVVRFDEVDINVPMEVQDGAERVPRQVVIRSAQTKSAEAIYAEIDGSRATLAAEGTTGAEDRWGRVFMSVLLRLPGPFRRWIVRRFTLDPHFVRRFSGTTFVTSVSRFAPGTGYAIPFLAGTRAVTFVLGPIGDKPMAVDGEVRVREVLGLTLLFNHDLVDGAPAARFAEDLKERIEHPRAA